MTTDNFRTEKDSMGELEVPANALYAAQTQRAVNNFTVSDLRWPRNFIRAVGLIKLADDGGCLSFILAELALLSQRCPARHKLGLLV